MRDGLLRVSEAAAPRWGDVELASVMRDGLLRVSEAAAPRWGDVELAGDGSGRIRISESKADQEAEGVVLYLGPAAALALLAIRPEESEIDAVTPVFNLHPDTIRRCLQQAARAAGIPGWRDITGHAPGGHFPAVSPGQPPWLRNHGWGPATVKTR